MTARIERLARRRAVLARLDREFTYESPGRISPRFKLTRAGRRLAADPPRRIRVRVTLRLHDPFGGVHAESAKLTMTRRGAQS